MALSAAVGQSQAQEASEAGVRAAQRALSQLGRNPPVLGFVFASPQFSVQQVIHGVSLQVGQIPLFGFSTPAALTSSGKHDRAVALGLIASSQVTARAGWWPVSQDEGTAGSRPEAVGQKILHALQPTPGEGILLLAGDGLTGGADGIITHLDKALASKADPPAHPQQTFLAGCLSGGDVRLSRTYQIGGQESDSAGLAAAYVAGRIAAGAGFNHGWASVGAYAKVTHSKGLRLHAFDERPAAETYARLFGRRPREWSLPPLNELVRLYPLGIEEEAPSGEAGSLEHSSGSARTVRHLIRSPLLMEGDGSLRMNMPIAEGKTGYLLVGSVSACLEAARLAARQALTQLKSAPGSPRPVFALVLVDSAWRMLMQAQPGEEVQAVISLLGKEVPVLGGYTLGQIGRTGPAGAPEVLNQQIEVIVFGEPRET